MEKKIKGAWNGHSSHVRKEWPFTHLMEKSFHFEWSFLFLRLTKHKICIPFHSIPFLSFPKLKYLYKPQALMLF